MKTYKNRRPGHGAGLTLTALLTISTLYVAVIPYALGQRSTGSAAEATITAPKSCTIRCTLENEKYSFYASERCLNALTRKELDEFNHKCVAKLERERRQRHSRSHCKNELASRPKTPESAEHLRNCGNPLTTDAYHQEVREWLSKPEPRNDVEANDRIAQFQRILARERQRQAEIKRSNK